DVDHHPREWRGDDARRVRQAARRATLAPGGAHGAEDEHPPVHDHAQGLALPRDVGLAGHAIADDRKEARDAGRGGVHLERVALVDADLDEVARLVDLDGVVDAVYLEALPRRHPDVPPSMRMPRRAMVRADFTQRVSPCGREPPSEDDP